MKNLLVTGGAGFIGSNFVRYMLDRYGDVRITNLDALTYAGNLENLAGLEADERYRFVKGDVAEPDDVAAVLADGGFDAVVHFAAESHVDRSLHHGAGTFIRTNIQGTQVLLDGCRTCGVARYLQVSTDEVYGSLGAEGRFTEGSPIAPNNPYAASKAGADFMVRAAWKSHGLNAVITRCSNNFGPYQFPEKLIPLMIANALEDKPLPVYGDGKHVRDWIYVIDHCSAVDTVLRKAEPGSVYNIGGDHDVPNIEIVRLILKILGKPESLIRFVDDRPGHDRRYAMDSSKIQDDLGWSPAHTFEQAMRETVDWYLAHRDWWERIRSGAYRDYYDGMYAARLKQAGA
ncbi:MAG: dTDP-glucose 4,6-dehydratase [Lentisphaerae bacterium]|nr:dTDP-glucose 4,6-dehydratase [Lentisphaerota bacterium]